MSHSEVNIEYTFEDINESWNVALTINDDDDLTEWIVGVSEVLSSQEIGMFLREMFFTEAVEIYRQSRQIRNIMDPQGDDPPIRPTLTKGEYLRMKSRRYHKTDKDKEFHQDTCVICTENFKSNNKIPILKCKHDFHWNCLKKWTTKTSKTCPSCRKDIS